MNKSEIAEKAARELVLDCGLHENFEKAAQRIVERAIAESQPQITLCPACNSYTPEIIDAPGGWHTCTDKCHLINRRNFFGGAIAESQAPQPGNVDLTREVECECDPMYSHRCMKCGGRGCVKRKAELGDGEPSPDVPLLEFDGRNIVGLKRCKKCGLSETYWERFPVCGSGKAALKSSPEPMFIRQIRQSYSMHNPGDMFEVTHSEMGELLEFLNASRAEGDTRELKAALRRYGDHDPSCPEFSQKPNRHNKGLVHDSAWPCNCGFEEKLK